MQQRLTHEINSLINKEATLQKINGGKKTSKRHPIRRTFRKKDRRQSKKKNVSRKKHHK